MTDPLLDVAAAAQRLGVDETTIRRYIRNGHLQASTLPGGRYRIRESAIDAMLTAGQVTPQAPVARAVRPSGGLRVVGGGSGSFSARVKARKTA
jgi:excisionase family DNA binding protein